MKNQFLLRLLKAFSAVFLLAMSTGTVMAVPDIAVEQPALTVIADGGTKGFGNVQVGSPAVLTFTIRNTGDANLTFSAPTFDGPNAAQFSAGAFSTPSPLAAGATTTFTVTCTPTSTGAKTAALHIVNNGPGTKNPYDINLTANGTAPVMVVEQPVGTVLTDPATVAYPDLLINTTQTLTFTIRNTATGPTAGALTGLSVSMSGTDAGFFTVTAAPGATVAAGSSTTFQLQFAPTTRRTYSAIATILNNDPTHQVGGGFVLNVGGKGIAPDIRVEAPLGSAVGPGGIGTASFGNVFTNTPGNLDFTILNTGDADLHLSGSVTSSNAAFVVKNQPTLTTIPPLGSTTFTVQFTPTTNTAFSGNVTINNDVVGKSPYVIPMSGTGVPAPPNSDAFGYLKTTSAPATAASFLKLTDPDVFSPAGLLSDDEFLQVDIGFSFRFYEKTYTRCFVATNGIVTFSDGTRSYTPHDIPSQTADPKNFIAPFWMDLDFRGAGASSKVFYATRGTTPDRVFIVKWQDAPEFSNTSNKATFEMRLYERDHSIEFQFEKKDAGFGSSGRNVGSGIESRDYGTTQPQPAGGVIGLKHAFGSAASSIVFPSAVRFARPVLYTVESKYEKPTGADPTVTVTTDIAPPTLIPTNRTFYQTPYGSEKRFEAPKFIYLDRAFGALPTAGEVTDANPAWYRLVNEGFSVDGQVIQGTDNFFTTTLTNDITVIWRWRLEYAVIIDALSGQQPGFGNPMPAVGREFRPLGYPFSASIASSVENGSAGIRVRTVGYTIYDKDGTAVSPGTGVPAGPFTFPNDTTDRRATLSLSVSQPIRLAWDFVGQVRYRFDAFSQGANGSLFNGQSFVRVYQSDRVTPDTTYGSGGIVYGNGANTDVWIESGSTVGRRVEVGAFYRPADQNLTLANFAAAPGGDLGGIGQAISPLIDATIPDQQGVMRVARIYTVTNANIPTEIHWLYQPTAFLAVVPLGKSLEVQADGTVLAGQLIPALAAGASLRVSDIGPGDTAGAVVKIPPPDGSFTAGNPLRWDQLGKGLFPVRPGSYEIAWPDGNNGSTSYRIEILTGYPGDTVMRSSPVEDTTGARVRQGTVTLANCATTKGSVSVTCTSTAGLQVGMTVNGPNVATGSKVASIAGSGTSFTLSTPATRTDTTTGFSLSAWNYLNTTVLPEIDPAAGFPAQAERAHYRHLFDPVIARQAPTKLDLSTTDEWKYQDLTFADAGTGAVVAPTTPGVSFTATGAGRSVLLYSYRPNRDEIADGSLARENLAVRVVRSSPVSVIPRTDSKLILGQHGLQLGGGQAASGGVFGIVGPSGSITPGNHFVVDFWLNAKGIEPSATVTLTNCTTNGTTTVTCASTAGLAAGMSISGPRIAAGTKVSAVTNGTTFVLSAAATSSVGQPPLTLTASYSTVTLTNCVTAIGTTSVTCDSTADVVAGMGISGTNIVPGTKIASITNATSFVLSVAATANGTGLSLTSENKPVTVLSSGSGGLKVTLDATAATTTATYRGISVTHPLSKAGAAWRHYVIHVFTQQVFGTGVTVVDFYLDGVRAEKAFLTSVLQGSADSTVSPALAANSFRLGVDADPLSALQIDQFRLFTLNSPSDPLGYLSPGEVRQLKTTRDMTVAPTNIASVTSATQFVLSRPATGSGTGLTLTAGGLTLTNCTTNGTTTVTCDSNTGLLTLPAATVVSGPNIFAGTLLRGYLPLLWFSFEAQPPSGGSFSNLGTLAGAGIGPVNGASPFPGIWANVDVQEVATRIDSTLDNAGFGGSGFIRNAVSNYNAELYQRTAEVGGWGPIFPVNHSQLYVEDTRKFEVVYYENPYISDPLPHPNVAWPYVATEYRDVTFPAVGPHKDKAIYIASRIGSEGVDQRGRPQTVFDLARYAALKIYSQPDNALAGYNPNEEHALAAPSGRAAVKVKNLGESLANNPPLAAFALQKDINNKPSYTSDAWVLVQVNNLQTGEPEMAAYKVFDIRAGTIAFPRPADSQVGGSTGLAYEPAATPEARFLTLATGATFNFEYKFEYPVFAGDLLVPPYPLNLAIGNASLADERGGNIQVNGVNQRTLWRDAGLHAWVVSGGGKFFNQFFYPMRADFYLPGAAIGKPIAWLPVSPNSASDFIGDDKPGNPSLDDAPRPVKVRYSSAWRSDYPKLKRGETLTYQGGEYFNENPGSEGLPALVAMKAAEVVYDSSTPEMVISAATTAELDKASARIIRPLDRREVRFTNAQMIAANLIPGDPATSKVIVVAERWYFKDLTGSLQKRFYFDSLAEVLVFRGRLNDKEGGDPNLTQGPDPINVLEPAVMTLDEYKKTAPEKGIYDLATTGDWQTAINTIFAKSQNPNGVTNLATSTTAPVFLQGVKPVPPSNTITATQKALLDEQKTFWKADLSGTVTGPDPVLSQLDSFGVGSALVPNASLLTMNPTGSLYVTLAENSRAELGGAPVSLHIIEIIPDRYRGAIKVHEGADAFSEKITLQHNGEFGANTGSLDYEWWIRDSRELDDTLRDEIATLATTLPDPNWQLYASGQGLHTIVFQGRPDVVLADKLVLMRYRHATEKPRGWKLVPFELPSNTTAAAAWKPANITPLSGAPFQWAGAANSPQFQADGSQRYIPQLVMGWVKRVLDRINPYEARYTDFFSNESPATYTSQIQILGGPYAGNVALNPDKNVIENTGLIELYRTVLDRARSLSIDNSSNGNSTDGINQALLLAATRLTVFYELLAREAYSDAQDSTIAVPEDSGLASVAPFTFAFQNIEPDLLHEELSLLRGTDFRKSYPVYNRMFWNYVKGLGEAAYNVNYNIYDVNKDGFINESDARLLYPQGHGDAWGHFLSAVDMHYLLLQNPNFSWKARAELYSLLQNVFPVDYLDEKTFAKVAAGKARAGRDIVRATYRLSYTQDPDGQWQGYTDGADKARAWGVSEWAHRAGQGAYFDWAVANALLPEKALDAAGKPLQNLSAIERSGAEDEIGEVAGSLLEIQIAMDEANGGMNPLGLDSDSINFDINQEFYQNDSGGDRRSHFEQVYLRAVASGANAVSVLQFATQANNKLRLIADDTEALLVEAFRQDLDYRNRLIEIFGRPYEGTIGFGKAYPEGYQGPDTLLFAYLDRTKIDQIVPKNVNLTGTDYTEISVKWAEPKIWPGDSDILKNLYTDTGLNKTAFDNAFKTFLNGSGYVDFDKPGVELSLPVRRTSAYAFQVDPSLNWGQRTSYGRLQQILERMLQEEIAVQQASANYAGFLGDLDSLVTQLEQELGRAKVRDTIGDKYETEFRRIRNAIRDLRAGQAAANIVVDVADRVATVVTTSIPDSIIGGLAIGGDVLSAGAAAVLIGANVVAGIANVISESLEADIERQSRNLETEIDALGRQLGRIDQIAEIEGIMQSIGSLARTDKGLRSEIGGLLQQLEITRQEYFTAQAEGFRILKERDAFNKILAANVQKKRYQDMIFRLTRNEAMAKYQSAFDKAARYVWLAAKAYDYETSLEPGDPAAPTELFNKIVRERQLGLWEDGPQSGNGGLAEILTQLDGNFQALQSQLGLENPQQETEKISMRSELFRIGPTLDPEIQAALDTPVANRTADQNTLITDNQDAINQAAASDARLTDVFKARIVPDLNKMPEFVRYCRPFSNPAEGPQPGIVIRFSTEINNGVNLFGRALVAGDHKYSNANYATKLRSFGVWLENYNSAGLVTSPRAYLVPIGDDYLRTSSNPQPITRVWSVKEQRIPTPYLLNQGQISAPGFIPTLNGLDGDFGDLRRHGDFRMYHDNGDSEADDSELVYSTRLVGRSVWNSEWMLVIPGANLAADPMEGVTKFAETISDIKIYFDTYSHQGR